ncbi:MAG: hypothetical protein KQI78_08990 [Deltaproteobacteria bacterium]|nr:hypothetical protein [Deltaproteobacteria bacterium]
MGKLNLLDMATSNIYQYLKRYYNQGKNYIEIVKWVIKKAFFKNFFKKPLGIIIFGGLRLSCQASAVTIIYFYSNALKNQGKFSFLNYELFARESILLMWLVIIATFLMFASASVFQYLTKIISISLAKELEMRIANEAVDAISNLPHYKTKNISNSFIKGEYKRILSDARRTGMLVRTFGYSIPELMSAIGGAASLIIIDPFLTVTLLIVVILVFICQYPSNIRGANYSKLFEIYAGKSNKIINDLIDSLFNIGHSKSDNAYLVKNFFLKKELKNSIDGFSGRVKVLEESTLINQIGTALVLSLTVLIVGYRLITGNDQNWGLLLAYIVSLRVAMHGVVAVGRALTSVSRFYPQIIRLYQLDMTNTVEIAEQDNLIRGDKLYIRNHKDIEFNQDNFLVKIPNKIGIYTIDEIDRKLYFILHDLILVKKCGKIVGLNKKPFYLSDTSECNNYLERCNSDNIDEIEIIFIKYDTLQKLSTKKQQELLKNNLIFIVYDKLNNPIFEENIYIFWSKFKIHNYLIRNELELDNIINEIKYRYSILKKKKKSVLEEDFEDDDDV